MSLRRVVATELLDSDQGTEPEIAASLADLARVGRWFGGVSTLAALVRRVAAATRQQQFTMLDVGAGAGDLARELRAQMARAGIDLKIILLDRSPQRFAGANRMPALAADALALPFRSQSFDLVACSTFAHHLQPQELIAFAGRALQVARRALLVNDLRRSAAHLALVYAGFPLFRSRITRHDAPASVRRAYTVPELRALLEQTGAARIEVFRHYLCRMGAIAWVK